MTYPKLRPFVIATLRRATYRFPPRYTVFNKARVSRGVYKCSLCSKEVRRKDMTMDHITPVVAVETGFPLTSDGRDDWTTYVERMFVDEPGWQALCKECDKAKMASERELRKYYRALKKKPIAKKKKKE